MMRNILCLFLVIFCDFRSMLSQVAVYASQENSLIRFTENKNQWENFIQFRAQLDGGALWVLQGGLTYGFYDKGAYRRNHTRADDAAEAIRTTGFDVKFVDCNENVIPEGTAPARDYDNYFIGNNPDKWGVNARNFTKIYYNNLWEGVSLEALGEENSVKYNFYVKAGSKPTQIKLQYTRMMKVSLKSTSLVIETIFGEIVERRPYAYQEIEGNKVEVPCNYKLKNNFLSFDFPQGYNKNYDLTIDPVLVFACSSGSLADNFGMTATYDQRGNLFSGGTAFANGFPVVNAYDNTYNGIVAPSDSITDVVVTKYDSSGTFLHYSTYLGGAKSSEIVTSLIVDKQDNLFLYGATGSTDFPTTSGAFDRTFNGGQFLYFAFNGTMFRYGTDIYVAKLSAAGNQLLASTFIGGSKNDGVNTSNAVVATTYPFPDPNCANNPLIYNITVTEPKADSLQYNYGDQYRGEIQLDNFGYPVINSSSRSSNFPTVNAIDNTLGGWQDAVVFKMDPNLSVMQWSTFIGGSNNEAGYALCIGKNNETYTTGGTRSSDFPATPGSYQSSYNGGKCDGYITKINPAGNAIIAATFFGTNDYDQSYFIQLNKNQDVFVYGQSLGNMPILNVGYSNPNSKQFISKLDNSLHTLLLSTVIGNGDGRINLSPAAFSVDYCDNIYLSGWGGNIIKGPRTDSMPLTSNAIQNTNPDGFNFYLMNLSKNCGSLLFGSYFGGSCSHEHVDGGTSRFDKNGIIYQSVCAGCGGFSDFPVLNPAWWPRPTLGVNWNNSSVPYRNCNNGTFKIDFSLPLVTANYLANNTGCAPLTVNFTNSSTNYSGYQWNFGGTDTTSTVLNPVRTFTAPGTYTVFLLAYNPAACNLADTTAIYITVYPATTSSFHFTKNKCGNVYTFIDSSYSNISSWYWNFGDGNSSSAQNPPQHTYLSSGTYTVSLIVNNTYGCPDTLKKVIVISGVNPVAISANQGICHGNSVQLTASGGISYSWTPSGGLSNPNIANPIANPTTTTLYSVEITQVNSSNDTCYLNLHTQVAVSNYSSSSLQAYAIQDTIFLGDTTHLATIVNVGSGNITWTPNYNISDVNSPFPIVNPSHTTTYSATFTDAYGCTYPIASETVYVITADCSPSSVYVPNTFTPNGDGHNDILYARSNFISKVYFAVYDRWGQKVFDTNDLSVGWNGIFNNKPCNPDVFGWYLEYTCNDGKTSFKKGNVTLIR